MNCGREVGSWTGELYHGWLEYGNRGSGGYDQIALCTCFEFLKTQEKFSFKMEYIFKKNNVTESG